ncbi:hypothetical protein [Methylomicrobium sp. Wu6]|uniref:hypothetical protein n=1 Tax=Methylomicrobium sp. Wu6 TaxID=3107928 RepID=UPI002DD63018|nr:hypothetical protein [Methylomicrobium sp. Wu6]MEC4750085.1 hypothetical protein [Methylomicrobium sp. Wu6]
MNPSSPPVSPYSADLSCRDLRRMIRVARLLHKLSENPAYQGHLESVLPASARFNPGHHAVMMGYDFHLAEAGPKLIEVNTNAGGIWYANLSHDIEATEFSGRLGSKLLKTFFDDYARYLNDPSARPETLAILDENPAEQPLNSEMQVFAALFKKAGIDAVIADPAEIEAKDGGLYFAGKRIEMIYNRHCDFYLESPAVENIRAAYLKGRVCLSPNPRAYGLLADKRRMMLWCQPAIMRDFGLPEAELSILAETVPETRLLASLTPEEAWRTRKQWVFKPETGYASRGVYVGEKLTKHKLAELVLDDILIQQRIPPSLTLGEDQQAFKTDYRLFAYRDRILGVSARIYQGQVTNLRTQNGGFAKVRLIA